MLKPRLLLRKRIKHAAQAAHLLYCPVSISAEVAPALYLLCPASCSQKLAEVCNCDLVYMQVVKIPDHLKGGLNKAGRKPNRGAVRRMSSGKFALS